MQLAGTSEATAKSVKRKRTRGKACFLQPKLGLLQKQDRLEKKKVGECLVATFLERKAEVKREKRKGEEQPEGACLR